ncbi:MAG: VWA domain-containing protein [Oscillospiraceae bacterium]|nr:VWA domain-containing protein [Ruminococcus sp.]MDD6098325.1 VWA domain-containing protein [Oscillospiraceae bacterium]
MPGLDDYAPAVRKVMTLFYVIDTSGSMQGSKIGQVESALEEVMQSLQEISDGSDDAEIKIAVLEFSTGASWITPEPVSPEGYRFKSFEACGVTDLGAACKELDKKLSRNEFLQTSAGAYPPVILLFSDGCPTDNWESGLTALQSNNWFKRSIKIAFAIGEDADKSILARFSGSSETVLDVKNKDQLRLMIEKASVITSVFASHSSSVEAETDPVEISKQLADEVQTQTQEAVAAAAADSSTADWDEEDW